MSRINQVFSSLLIAGSALTSSMMSPAAFAETAPALSVIVENIDTPQGTVMIAVFKGEEAYKTNKPVSAASAKVEGTTVSASFTLEPGQYGIKLYHDVNDDGKMNTNPFGMPTEPFGFSNNAPVRFGPPGWSDAMFDVSGDGTTTQIITIN